MAKATYEWAGRPNNLITVYLKPIVGWKEHMAVGTVAAFAPEEATQAKIQAPQFGIYYQPASASLRTLVEYKNYLLLDAKSRTARYLQVSLKKVTINKVPVYVLVYKDRLKDAAITVSLTMLKIGDAFFALSYYAYGTDYKKYAADAGAMARSFRADVTVPPKAQSQEELMKIVQKTMAEVVPLLKKGAVEKIYALTGEQFQAETSLETFKGWFRNFDGYQKYYSKIKPAAMDFDTPPFVSYGNTMSCSFHYTVSKSKFSFFITYDLKGKRWKLNKMLPSVQSQDIREKNTSSKIGF